MTETAVTKLLYQYDNLTVLIKAAAERGDANIAELQELWNSFGNLLCDFLQERITEVTSLSKQLEAQKAESEELSLQLQDALTKLEKAIPKDDYAYAEKICKKEYEAVWLCIEEKTQLFLITAYYILRLIKAHNSDFSPVVIEFSKALEGEVHAKLYTPYLQYRKTPLPISDGNLGDFMKGYFAGKKTNVPLSLMFSSLEYRRQTANNYYHDLHTYIKAHNWHHQVLANPSFYEEGLAYARQYRNDAAHSAFIDEALALGCKKKTGKLIKAFVIASPYFKK